MNTTLTIDNIYEMLSSLSVSNKNYPTLSDEQYKELVKSKPEALKFVSTLSAKGGHPVPPDEDGRDARIEKFHYSSIYH